MVASYAFDSLHGIEMLVYSGTCIGKDKERIQRTSEQTSSSIIETEIIEVTERILRSDY